MTPWVRRRGTGDGGRGTGDGGRTTNDGGRGTGDGGRTTNDGRRTTNDGRPTTEDRAWGTGTHGVGEAMLGCEARRVPEFSVFSVFRLAVKCASFILRPTKEDNYTVPGSVCSWQMSTLSLHSNRSRGEQPPTRSRCWGAYGQPSACADGLASLWHVIGV